MIPLNKRLIGTCFELPEMLVRLINSFIYIGMLGFRRAKPIEQAATGWLRQEKSDAGNSAYRGSEKASSMLRARRHGDKR